MTGIDLQIYDKDEEEVDFQYGEKKVIMRFTATVREAVILTESWVVYY